MKIKNSISQTCNLCVSVSWRETNLYFDSPTPTMDNCPKIYDLKATTRQDLS